MHHNSLQEAERDVEEPLEKLLLKLSLHQSGDLSFAVDDATGWLVSVTESDLNKGEMYDVCPEGMCCWNWHSAAVLR